MKSNKEYLSEALGIKGQACFVTVSEITGLTVDEILNLDSYSPCDGDIRAISHHFTGKRRYEEERNLTEYDFKGYDNVMYWRGVLDAIKGEV